MGVPVETLRTHLHYAAWATRRIVDAAGRLPVDQLTHDFKSADKSVLGTLAHVYGADRMWLGRIQGHAPARLVDPDVDHRLTVLQHDWPALLDRWQAWGGAVQEPTTLVHYADLQGNPHATPIWQIVLHVVNHGTHHRGQAAAMMRALGHAPPPLDLIRYYREHAH